MSYDFVVLRENCFAILSWNLPGLLFAPHPRSVPENGYASSISVFELMILCPHFGAPSK
jgi:hypothetical protein